MSQLDNALNQAPHGGIHLGDVRGNVEFSALGDIVGGDKIVNITTTIQISAKTCRLILAPYCRILENLPGLIQRHTDGFKNAT
jgi:hypothetical protein